MRKARILRNVDFIVKCSRLIQAEWLGLGPAERRFLAPLLIGLYAAESAGRQISKKEAHLLMGTDAATTGPKYLRLAEKEGLLVIEKGRGSDRRIHVVRITAVALERLDSFLESCETI